MLMYIRYKLQIKIMLVPVYNPNGIQNRFKPHTIVFLIDKSATIETHQLLPVNCCHRIHVHVTRTSFHLNDMQQIVFEGNNIQFYPTLQFPIAMKKAKTMLHHPSGSQIFTNLAQLQVASSKSITS